MIEFFFLLLQNIHEGKEFTVNGYQIWVKSMTSLQTMTNWTILVKNRWLWPQILQLAPKIQILPEPETPNRIGEQIIPEVAVYHLFLIHPDQIIPVYQVMEKNYKILTIPHPAKIIKNQLKLMAV